MSTSPSNRSAAAAGPQQGRGIHLGYLDGVRGLAALYVLLEHVQLTGLYLIGADRVAPGTGTPLQHFARFLNAAGLGFGHLAVNVFIVLSGFCLMLPVAQSSHGRLRGGVGGYVKRRALRILPPYYAALFVSMVVLLVIFEGNLPALGQWVSHLLLIHNATPEWLYGINAPMWSIAVEWQIYFVFALVLLPVWRRLGGAATVAVGLALGLAPLYLLPAGRNLEWSSPWYIGLFAFGMVASAISVRSGGAGRWARVWWGPAAVLFCVATVAVFFLQRASWFQQHWAHWLRMEHRGGSWLLDVMVGLAVSCALLSLSRTVFAGGERRGVNGRLLAVLESRPVGVLGAFSYSLYLIHSPLLAGLKTAVDALQLSPFAGYATVWVVGVPLGLAGGYLFYLAVERHCLGAKVNASGAAATLAEESPRGTTGETATARPLAAVLATAPGTN